MVQLELLWLLSSKVLLGSNGIFGRRGGPRIGGGGGGAPGRGLTAISGDGAGRTRTTSVAAARRFASRFGRDAAEKRFGRDAVSTLGGRFGRSRVTNAVRKGATGIANRLGGRQGIKTLSSLGKIGSKLKIPVIGSIISVVMSLMNGDPIQKSIVQGNRNNVGGIIGGAITGLGTFFTAGVGVFLAPIVMGISSAFGDFVGDLLYTLFLMVE